MFTEPSFRRNLITEYPDDNKLADLAISSNAEALVTFDRHFDIFKNISFPDVTVLKPIEFEKLFT